MLLPFAMPVQKFVMLVRRNAKNTTWIIANVAQKRAGGARKNAVQWPNNLPNCLNTINLEDMYCPQGLSFIEIAWHSQILRVLVVYDRTKM